MPPPPAEDAAELPGRFSQLHLVVLTCGVEEIRGRRQESCPYSVPPLSASALHWPVWAGRPPTCGGMGRLIPASPRPCGLWASSPSSAGWELLLSPRFKRNIKEGGCNCCHWGRRPSLARGHVRPSLPGVSASCPEPLPRFTCPHLPPGGWGWGSGRVPGALPHFPLSCSPSWKSSALCLPCQAERCFWPAVGSVSPPAGQFTDCCLCRATHRDPDTQELGRVM